MNSSYDTNNPAHNSNRNSGNRNSGGSGGTQTEDFEAFYARHLAEHRDPVNRRYHYLGIGFSVVLFAMTLCSGDIRLALLIPVSIFGLAWFGHRFVEKNQPDTFTVAGMAHWRMTVRAHFRMFLDIVAHRIDIR